MRVAAIARLCLVGLLCVARRASSIAHQHAPGWQAEKYVSHEGVGFSIGTVKGALVHSVINVQNVAPYFNKYVGRTGILFANGESLNRCALF